MKRPLIGVNSTYYADKHRWYKVPLNYINAIQASGGLPVILPCKPDERTLMEYIQELDGMVFTGGDDYPPEWSGGCIDEKTEHMPGERAETDRMLMKMILEKTKLPVLGICAGHQLLALYHGQKLIQHIPEAAVHGGEKDTVHAVRLEEGSRIKSIFKQDTIIVNSNHHQAVAPGIVSEKIFVSAWSDEGIIEAIEERGDRFVMGVQWHPERVESQEHTRLLFTTFMQKAAERKMTE